MIEYGLLASLIAVAAIVTLKLIGPQVDTAFKSVNTALTP
jgi:Flp pilus assembly pilin Flp